MKKILKILLILVLLTGIGFGAFFIYTHFFKDNHEVDILKTDNPFYENIGELAVVVNEKYKVPISKTMSFNDGKASLNFKLKELKEKERTKYYFEDDIIYTKTNYKTLKDDDMFKDLKKYLNVEFEDLFFLKSKENSKVLFIDSSWKVLNIRDNDMITIVLKRIIEKDTTQVFEYQNELGDIISVSDNEYNNVSFKMKQSANSVIFSLYGEDVDSFNIKEIDEIFEGDSLLFIKESLNRFDKMKVDSFKHKTYSDVSGKYYINISSDYSNILKKKEIIFLQDDSNKTVELIKELDEENLDLKIEVPIIE